MMMRWPFGVLTGIGAVAFGALIGFGWTAYGQTYINRGSSVVSICAELRGMVGMQRSGMTLRSINTCSASRGRFSVSGTYQ